MNRVLQPRPLVLRGLNVWMGTAAGADELVEMGRRGSGPRGSEPFDMFIMESQMNMPNTTAPASRRETPPFCSSM